MNPFAWFLGDLLTRPRLVVPILLGIAAGAALFHLTGKEPSSAAMALGCAAFGLVIGFALEYLRDTPRDPLD
ncbi:MAG TPA: hypothetical protein VGE09_03080 [Pseudoxanthomonas sp.]